MAKTDFNIPGLGGKFVDLRDILPGDAYNWSWVRPLSQVQFLAIHHSGGPDNQTSWELADYHINNNRWGGIGYHFTIDKEGRVYYVGDLQTARASVADLNEKVIGICLIGNFTNGNEPTAEQFDSARKLCDFFINDYKSLLNINSWDCVYGHKELPNQSTVCPGDNWPSWKQKIITGNPLTSGGIVFNSPVQEEKSELSEAPASLQGQIAMLEEKVVHQKTQIESLQLSLATINGQLISCRESLREAESGSILPTEVSKTKDIFLKKEDDTLTLIDALINLYKFALPGKSNV